MVMYTVFDGINKQIATLDYDEAFSNFLGLLFSKAKEYSGALTENGLPYSYGTYIWNIISLNDLEHNLSSEEIKNLDNIYKLFYCLNLMRLFGATSDFSEVINEIKNNSNEEWDLKITEENEEIIIEITSNKFFVKTNVFTDFDKKINRYYIAHLDTVISCKDSKYKLGDIVDINLMLVKINDNEKKL